MQKYIYKAVSYNPWFNNGDIVVIKHDDGSGYPLIKRLSDGLCEYDSRSALTPYIEKDTMSLNGKSYELTQYQLNAVMAVLND